MTETKGALAWQEAEATAFEARAEAIDVAINGLRDLDGMFSDSGDKASAIATTLDLLEVEADNYRGAAGRVRGGRDAATVVALRAS